MHRQVPPDGTRASPSIGGETHWTPPPSRRSSSSTTTSTSGAPCGACCGGRAAVPRRARGGQRPSTSWRASRCRWWSPTTGCRAWPAWSSCALVKERWPSHPARAPHRPGRLHRHRGGGQPSEIFRFIWKPWDDGHLLSPSRAPSTSTGSSRTTSGSSSLLERRQRGAGAAQPGPGRPARGPHRRALVRPPRSGAPASTPSAIPLAIIRRRVRGGPGQRRLRPRRRRAPERRFPASGCTDHAYGAAALPGALRLPPRLPPSGASPSASRIWLLRSFPFEPGAGQVVVFKDVTEEREVTRRLFHAEKMSAVGQLAGGVAHEINNPLGGILAFAQIMSREERTTDDMENLRADQDAAIGPSASSSRCSASPAARARSRTGPVDAGPGGRRRAFLLSSQLNADGTHRHPAPASRRWPSGNANQLQQIVVNLLVNALQAMNGEGHGGHRHRPRLRAGRVRLSVTDNGPGVPARDRPSASSSRSSPPSRRGRGPGLGLSICYRIAEEHGGAIRARDRPGARRLLRARPSRGRRCGPD